MIQGQTRACGFMKEAGCGPLCSSEGNTSRDTHPGTAAGLVVWRVRHVNQYIHLNWKTGSGNLSVYIAHFPKYSTAYSMHKLLVFK